MKLKTASFRLSPVLALFLAHSAQAVPSQPDNWFVSQYGPITSCHSLRANTDGTFTFDRYLVVAPDDSEQVDDVDGLSGLKRSSRGIGRRLLNNSGQKPDRVPFFHEHYQLNYTYHILNGEQIHGSFSRPSLNEPTNSYLCVGMGKRVDQASDNLVVAFRQGVRGELLEPNVEGKAEPRVLSEGTTPLALLASGYSRTYSGVYDPLFHVKESVEFTPSDYKPYSMDHIGPFAVSGAVSSVLTVAGAVMSFMIPMAGPVAGLGLGGSAGQCLDASGLYGYTFN